MKGILSKKKLEFLIPTLLILFILMCMFFPRMFTSHVTTNVNLENYAVGSTITKNGDAFVYLSDMEYIKNQSKTAWGSILKDTTSNGSKISVKVEGAYYTFDKGMWAHATSTLVYDITDYNYKYFTAFVGLNQTAASSSNGVKFYVYTSVDGTNWDLKTAENPEVKKAGANADFVKVNIEGAKYLKLIANDNGSNGNDHAVYADAKLTNDETDGNVVKSVEEFDQILKSTYANADLTNPNYELTLLQRNLVKNMGQYAINRFVKESKENRETFEWLFDDLENLRMYTLGGKPAGSYYNSFNVLKSILAKYKNDFSNQELTKYGHKYGDLYKKMAITLSLTHSTRVSLWMQPSAPENQSDAVTRYEIYKNLHKQGKFVVSDSIDITEWFEEYNIEEMRFVLNNIIDDEEILWLNEYTQKRIDANPNRVWSYLTPHPYMKYIWPNYGRPEFHDEANKKMWDEKYDFLRYGVTFRPGLYKLWMNLENGAVCGGISKIGTNIRAVHGIPSAVIGQPGHAAIVYYTRDAQGRGYWNIDNDVSGWSLSEKGERMLLGWGNASWSKGYSVVYMVLAQEVLNNYETFEKSEKMVMLADVYNNDLKRQEEVYREALKIQPLNINAWYGLINTYLNNASKTEDDFYKLAQEIAQNLKYFPLPMYHLTNLIKPKLVSVENSYKFTLLQTRTLTEGSQTPSNTADTYYVYQPSVTRTEANYLLGKIDKTIATFSFDGDDAGKIVLASRFDNTGVRWDYSLDGKKSWNEVSFTAEEEHKLPLTAEEIASITSENDIYIHIVGVNYDEENLYKIDITDATLPTLFANDLENRVMGATLTMEWRYKESDAWTSYNAASPDLTGDKSVQVRVGATGTNLPSASVTYTFTEDNQPDTRKYIPVSHLSIEAVSSEATGHAGHATNAIDGNYNTRWHSNWNGADTERYITIKLDKSVYLSAVEFVPAGGGNGKIYDGTIWGSMDGENWVVLTESKNLTYTNQANTIEDAIANTKAFEIEEPKEVQYVKIVADRTNGNWFTARAFNFYQDITKNPHPTAGVAYSTTDPTNQEVIARLVNLSSPDIIITSEGGDTHTFTENGEFTFAFYDTKTNKEGSAIAKVNWIDKIAPTASIKYSTTSPTTAEVVATLIDPSEEIEIINNLSEEENSAFDPYTYTFTENGEFTFEFRDRAGNIGKVTAKVDWIRKEVRVPKSTISYSTTKWTNQDVTATITFDGNAFVSNNYGKNTYLFKENGKFTFEYQDGYGNSGSATAEVNWIDKIAPTASVIYNITTPTSKNVVATLINISEDIIILNEEADNTHTFTENGTYEFRFRDRAGNYGKAVAKVDWIDKSIQEEDLVKDVIIEVSIVGPAIFETETVTAPNQESISSDKTLATVGGSTNMNKPNKPSTNNNTTSTNHDNSYNNTVTNEPKEDSVIQNPITSTDSNITQNESSNSTNNSSNQNHSSKEDLKKDTTDKNKDTTENVSEKETEEVIAKNNVWIMRTLCLAVVTVLGAIIIKKRR